MHRSLSNSGPLRLSLGRAFESRNDLKGKGRVRENFIAFALHRTIRRPSWSVQRGGLTRHFRLPKDSESVGLQFGQNCASQPRDQRGVSAEIGGDQVETVTSAR